jgi:hypothetical protein
MYPLCPQIDPYFTPTRQGLNDLGSRDFSA